MYYLLGRILVTGVTKIELKLIKTQDEMKRGKVGQ